MSGFSRYVTLCHCGHDKATHFETTETCLGMLCDCPKYVDRDDPKPVKAKPAPPPPPVADDAVTPYVHPFWCLCPQCHPAGQTP